MSEGFTNSIIGGAETLIRSAIKSVNYVLGIAGWRISRAGSAEFSDATIRGSISADGGNILLNSGGLHIQGSGHQYDINKDAGFLARELPDTGLQSQMVSGALFLTSQDPSPLGNAVDFGFFAVGYNNSGAANEAPTATIAGNQYTGKVSPEIILVGQSADSSIDNSKITMQGRIETANLTAIVSSGSNVGPIGAISVVLSTASINWLANSAYRVRVLTRFQPTNTTTPRVVWTVRKTNAAGAVIANLGRQTAISVEPYNTTLEGIFTVGASPVTAVIALAMASGSAAGVNDITALAPIQFEIEWIGGGAAYPDQAVLT